MSTATVVRILTDHKMAVMVSGDGTVRALSRFSKMTPDGVVFGEEWEIVPTGSVRELADWLGY